MSRFIIPGLIIGSKVSIAKFGAVIGNDEPSKTVSADWLPVPPTAEAPGPWLYMGRIRTSNPQIETKTGEIEGANDGGTYETEELQLTTKRRWSLAPALRRSTSMSIPSGRTPTATGPES